MKYKLRTKWILFYFLTYFVCSLFKRNRVFLDRLRHVQMTTPGISIRLFSLPFSLIHCNACALTLYSVATTTASTGGATTLQINFWRLLVFLFSTVAFATSCLGLFSPILHLLLHFEGGREECVFL